jgi:hypothetical protein
MRLKPKIITSGWRAGWQPLRLNLNGRSATRPGRKLAGDELEAAKRRLMERYRDNRTPPSRQ